MTFFTPKLMAPEGKRQKLVLMVLKQPGAGGRRSLGQRSDPLWRLANNKASITMYKFFNPDGGDALAMASVCRG